MDRETTRNLLVDAADSSGVGGEESSRGLERRLGRLQEELGHGHPDVLVLEEQLAHKYIASGATGAARALLEEVLIYRAVADGEHGERTARVACDLFRLLGDQGDRPAMAEVYYRYLSWIPMRDPSSLTPRLRAILGEVEEILARSC